MRNPFRRQRPTARDLIAAALLRKDYRAAAVLITAGSLAVLHNAAAVTNEDTTSERTLRVALAKIHATR